MLRKAIDYGWRVFDTTMGGRARMRRLSEFVEAALPAPRTHGAARHVEAVSESAAAHPTRTSAVHSFKGTVSIVVNTVDRAALLERLLTSLERLRYRPFEVVVVVGPCTDHTDEVLARWRGRIKHLTCPTMNLATSRNIGLTAACGDVVAFIDDDAVPEPDWLDHLMAEMADPRVGAAGGAIRDRSGIRFQAENQSANHLAMVRPTAEVGADGGDWCLTLTGTNFCVRRSAALAIDGFDESFAYFLEETDLQRRLHRAGHRLAYVAAAEVHHGFAESAIRDADRVPRDYRTILTSLVYFCLKHDPTGHGHKAIAHRVAHRLDQIRRRIERLKGRAVLEPAGARTLWTTALKGVTAGGRLPVRPSRRLEIRPDCEPFLPFLPFRSGATPALRIALVAVGRMGPPAIHGLERLAAALGRAGHEVSLLLPHARHGRVEYRDHHWQHRVADHPQPPTDVAGAIEIRHPEIWAELERVRSHRLFEVLVTARHLNGDCALDVAAFPATDRGTPANGASEKLQPVAYAELAAAAAPVLAAIEQVVGAN